MSALRLEVAQQLGREGHDRKPEGDPDDGPGVRPFTHNAPKPAIDNAVPRLPTMVDQALAFSFA
jgi:hypothetical protein